MGLYAHSFATFVFIFLCFALCVYAHPDAGGSYNAPWEWNMYGMGGQLAGAMASNEFVRMVSFGDETDRRTEFDIFKASSPTLVTSGASHRTDQTSMPSPQQGYTTAAAGNYTTSQSPGYTYFPQHQNYVTTSQPENDYMEVAQMSAVSQGMPIPNSMTRTVQQWRPEHYFAQSASMVPNTSDSHPTAFPMYAASIQSPPSGILANSYQRMHPYTAEEVHMGQPQIPIHHADHYSYEPLGDRQNQIPRSLPNVQLHPPTYEPVSSAPEAQCINVMSNGDQSGLEDSTDGMIGWRHRHPSNTHNARPWVDANLLQPSPTPVSRSLSPASSGTTATSSSLVSTRPKRWQMARGKPAFVCHWCNAGFRAQGDLTHHLRCHQPYRTRAHACQHCGRRFQYRKDLIRHLPKHDPNARRFYCPHEGCKYASKGFGRRDHLDRHIGTQHPADTPHHLSSSGSATNLA